MITSYMRFEVLTVIAEDGGSVFLSNIGIYKSTQHYYPEDQHQHHTIQFSEKYRNKFQGDDDGGSKDL
jgi:hypothetical protein